MDWLSSRLKSGLEEAQRKAAEAAESARALAQQASAQGRVLAQTASVRAQQFAEQASAQAKVLVEEATHVQDKLLSRSGTASQQQQQGTVGREELQRFGVTDGLLECIGGLTYSMFSDMKSEMFAAGPSGSQGGAPEHQLTPWQERHAVLVLGQAPHLQGLRFALSPRHMSDYQFWAIYFKLVNALLPSEADRDRAMLDSALQRSTAASSTEQPTAAASAKGVFSSLLRNTQGILQPSATTPGQPAPSSTQVGNPAANPSTSARSATAASSQAQQPSHATSMVSASSNSVSHASLLAPHDAAAADRQGEEVSPAGSIDAGDSPALSEGLSEPLGDLDDDPELAAYLQEALAVHVDEEGHDDGKGEGLSDLGSAAEDLDDYINQLDAELAAKGGQGSINPSPQKPT